MMNAMRKWLILGVAALSVLGIASCRGDKASPEKAPAGGIEKKTERGPVSAVVRLDKTEMTIADRLNLVIEVTAKGDCDVELPPLGDKLEQFAIVDYRTAQPQLVGTNEVVFKRSYVLEPFLSGEYTISPLKVTFRKKNEAQDVKHELETAELTVKVKSLLPEKVKELKINDIASPVRFPRSLTTAVWIIAAAVVLLLAAVAVILVVFWVRRGSGAVTPPPLPPHELAYRRLRELVAEDLVGKGQIKVFYQRISDILRHYIEGRFGLHAPEQTTEEFLYGLGAGDSLVVQHKSLLKTFLYNCDLVKFAEHQPDAADIQATFDSCKRFIAETEPKEVSG